MSKAKLIEKYNVQGPRYTSYPTVPYWEQESEIQDHWKEHVKQSFEMSNEAQGIALYIHLPFCSNACTYCGCNVRFTQNHKVELPYIEYVLKEWKLYLGLMNEVPRIAEVHIGGGTPTFFSPENLHYLLNEIFKDVSFTSNAELSFEGNPESTSKEHLTTLYNLGFRRLSLGIQDFDPNVQELINRIQSVQLVESVVKKAREIGYNSINFDLIYGLPQQRLEAMQQTLTAVIRLKPDRIAFYSYAHVPWIKGIQRRFTEEDLPKGDEKRALYELGKTMFEKAGYVEIGMDHFALPTDGLVEAFNKKALHRNFMGYSTNTTQLMVGLGVSSISDTWTAFGQNEKQQRKYEKKIDQGQFPVFRGHLLTDEDLNLRKHILNIMCHFQTSWSPKESLNSFYPAIMAWREMERDGLLVLKENTLLVTERGKPFVRNICMALDARLQRSNPEKQLFSSTV